MARGHDEAEENAVRREIVGMAREVDQDRLPGYKMVVDYDEYIEDKEDYEIGYCVYGSLDLNDMFGAFQEPNRGLVGGARTVDDFTPEGVADIGGATGGEGKSQIDIGHKYP